MTKVAPPKPTTAPREQRRLLVDLPSQRLKAGAVGSVVRTGPSFFTMLFNGRFVTLTLDKVSAPIAASEQ